MTGSCIAHGLRTAHRSAGLVALLWLWTVLLAAIAAYPAWAWFGQGFNLAPESDRLLTGFSFSTFAELGQYDRSSLGRVIVAVLAGIAIFALLANSFVAGGLIGTLVSSNGSRLLRRFLRGCATYFWRYLRLLLCGAVTAAIVLAALSASLSPLIDRLSKSSWEPGGIVGIFAQTIVLFLAGGLLLTALDFARARIALENHRSAVRVWVASLGFVLRRIPSSLMLFLAPVVLFSLLLVLYGVFVRYTPSDAVALVILLVAVQQLVMFCRASLRVSLVASVVEYARLSAPPPAQPAAALGEAAGPHEPLLKWTEVAENPDEQVQI